MNIIFRIFFLVTFYLPLHANAQTKEVKYLSGTDNKTTVTWDFFCTSGRNSGVWSKIQVPSHWEQQGFGAYNYGRDYKTYGRNFRFSDEQGLYKHRFTIPSSWKGKQVFIVFEGSMTDTEVKINGKSAGEKHQGAFYRFKYNITDKLNFGKENLLEATVSKMSSEESVNNAERLADYWVFGGIFRPVYLEAVPESFVDHVSIDAKADGSFRMNVFLQHAKQSSTITADIFDSKGSKVATAKANTSGDSVVLVTTKVNNPLLWNSETPNLYKVNVHLADAGKTVFSTSEKFGFRTIEVRKGMGIYINGVQVKMKGVNRHVWWPETGRSVNAEIDLADVKLMKDMNMNAVRCAHYPPDKRFLEICDSLGLYVLDELAGWQKAYSTTAGEKLVKEMVTRDANHASIIFWSNGNEGGHNFNLDDDFGKHDLSQRPVIHAHHRPGNAFNGIDCNHYEDYYSTQRILNDSNIYMVTEFLHSQDDGGAAAGLADFWEQHWASQRSGGGFLWALVDEGIVRTDLNNIIDVNGVNAPDGIVGPHREKEGSYYAIKEVFSPVKVHMKHLPENFNGRIPIENRFHFTNLKQCTFNWALVNFRKPGDQFTGYDIIKSGNVAGTDISPQGGKGELRLSLPDGFENHDALLLTVQDPFKNILSRWTWKLRKPSAQIGSIVRLSDTAMVNMQETDSTISLRGGEVAVVLSKKDGQLISVRNVMSDPLSFSKGPLLVNGTSQVTGVKHFSEAGGHAVEATYSGNMKSVKWKMNGSGWLSLEYEYQLDGTYPFAGVSFTYPENFVLGTKWLGKGPYRVWKNRLQGVTDNVWQSVYNNTHTGAAPWIYPEFKGYYADVSWMEFNTVEGKFTVVSPDSGLYVRLFNSYGLSGVRPHPELPPGDISFLDFIPPIGTKLALNISYNTSALGPQSEPNKINETVKRKLYFYFGIPKPENNKKQFTMPAVNDLF